MKAYLDLENGLKKEDSETKKLGVLDVISRGDRQVPAIEIAKSHQSIKARLEIIKSDGQVDNNKTENEEANLRNLSSPN